MQLYVGDYLRDTRHLTAEQHGAYLLLLMAAWNAGGKLPNDPRKLARLAACTPSRWAKIADDLMEFFEVDGDHITNRRLSLELKKASEKSIKRAEAGTRGGQATALKSKEPKAANATVLPQHSSEPEPEKKELSTNVERRAPVLAKGCSLPDGWLPNPDDFLKAIDLIGAERAAAELEKFTDYWRGVPGAKGRKLDWPATYRNWIRRTAESTAQNAKPDKLAARHDNYAASWTGADGAAELMAARRAF
jgi:uncharacterized protein YdaU (DUF1376 family)